MLQLQVGLNYCAAMWLLVVIMLATLADSPDFRLFRDSIAVAEHLVAEGMGVFMEVAVHFTTRERLQTAPSVMCLSLQST